MLLSAPTVPLLFLLLQLVMAVILLHVFAFALPRHVQLPKLELQTMKKLAPVVSVSLCGLVFNTLCLRAVEAAFFQVRTLSAIVESSTERDDRTRRLRVVCCSR